MMEANCATERERDCLISYSVYMNKINRKTDDFVLFIEDAMKSSLSSTVRKKLTIKICFGVAIILSAQCIYINDSTLELTKRLRNHLMTKQNLFTNSKFDPLIEFCSRTCRKFEQIFESIIVVN